MKYKPHTLEVVSDLRNMKRGSTLLYIGDTSNGLLRYVHFPTPNALLNEITPFNFSFETVANEAWFITHDTPLPKRKIGDVVAKAAGQCMMAWLGVGVLISPIGAAAAIIHIRNKMQE